MAFSQKLFQKYKEEIKSEVDKILLEHGARTLRELCQMSSQELLPKIPRYMRINQIKSSVECVIKDLKAEEWEFVGNFSQDDFKARALSLTQWQFGLDPVLPDLLVFPPGTDLHDHPLTTSGVLVQQDRSFFVSEVMRYAGYAVGKSSKMYLSCFGLHNSVNSRRVIALDRDFKRLSTMTRLVGNSGATCVELIHQDFLTVEPTSADAEAIKFILVDPSCSGSGMLNNQTNSRNSDLNTDRVQTLKRFQISILKHALKFPNVQRVVYSTCSVHQQENEEVAEEVMSQVNQQFQFAKVFPSWKGSRGLRDFPHSEFFLRLSPEQDLTQGFFVACFQRVTEEKVLKTEDSELEDNTIRRQDQVDLVDTGYTSTKRKKKKICGQGIDNMGEKLLDNKQVEAQLSSNDADLSKVQTEVEVGEVRKRKKKKRKHESLGKVEVSSETASDSVHEKMMRKDKSISNNDLTTTNSNKKTKKKKKV
ncbi:ribosomal RNA small subunit methyltransferase F [Elysia marginata]|uniref:Ribosomal RNA small subunit methyltransferase F n=1 Tax=Elysia marginata TaxID=1093978 RepID=A0AAV4G411_9GAST|nr:ribosomal RNA small subunit methyltransferase F [Elysia marginata]